jgi:hypothetical protein
MMKSAFVAAALCVSAPALAADPPPVWVGGFLVTDATGPSCEQSSIQVNEMYTLVFHPKLTGDTTVATDVFQILTYQKAFQFIPKGGARFQASGSYGAATWNARAIVKKFAGTYSGLTITPALAANRKFLNIAGKFNKVDGQNCAVTFAAAVTLKD